MKIIQIVACASPASGANHRKEGLYALLENGRVAYLETSESLDGKWRPVLAVPDNLFS